MNRTIFFIGIVILFVFNSCKKEAVTLESLLGEMTDRTVLTQLPENPYTLKQFSSYDRKSVSPDDNNWWANADYTQFVREEKNEGRREFVLLDAAGPGAVVRFWMTFAGDGATDGILRFYIDNNETPEIVGNALEIIPTINEKFDLVFIDADKSNYSNYFNLIIDKMNSGGVILSDNVLWSGKIVEKLDPKDVDTNALITYNKLLNDDDRIETVMLPIRDGLTISRVK